MAIRGARQRRVLRGLGERRRRRERGAESENRGELQAHHRYSPRLARIARGGAVRRVRRSAFGVLVLGFSVLGSWFSVLGSWFSFYRPVNLNMNARRPATAKNWPIQNANIHRITSQRTS